MHFPKGNAIAQLNFRLAWYDLAVRYVSHYATGTHPPGVGTMSSSVYTFPKRIYFCCVVESWRKLPKTDEMKKLQRRHRKVKIQTCSWRKIPFILLVYFNLPLNRSQKQGDVKGYFFFESMKETSNGFINRSPPPTAGESGFISSNLKFFNCTLPVTRRLADWETLLKIPIVV